MTPPGSFPRRSDGEGAGGGEGGSGESFLAAADDAAATTLGPVFLI